MRNERNDEFAPPSLYNQEGGRKGPSNKGPSNNRNFKKRKMEEESLPDDPIARGLRNLKNLVDL